ncbi:MAG: hypothetical protein M3A44_13185 [Gammaproteobacteria bacterium]
MHDINRTFMEYNPEAENYESEQFEFTESEWSGESGEVFHESELMELATELLEVTNEAELNHFLGSLIRRAGSALGQVVKSPVGQALGGILKGAARQALPMAGSALGGYLGGSSGAQIGGQLASGAGRVFGLETEGLSHEDETYEVAKQYVRFAADAVKNAATAPPGDPRAVAQSAATQAAQRHAPGLLRGTATPAQAGGVAQGIGRGRTGRWVRRGNRIILYGV